MELKRAASFSSYRRARNIRITCTYTAVLVHKNANYFYFKSYAVATSVPGKLRKQQACTQLSVRIITIVLILNVFKQGVRYNCRRTVRTQPRL